MPEASEFDPEPGFVDESLLEQPEQIAIAAITQPLRILIDLSGLNSRPLIGA